MGECGGTELFGQLLLRSRFRRRWSIDRFAVDDGAEDLGAEKLLGRRSSDVAVEDDQVGDEAWLEAAFYRFAEFAEGGGLGISIDRFVERELFLELEGLGTGFVLAGDGGVKAAKGIDEFDGVVRAEGEDDVVVEEGLPGVGVFVAL